MTEGRRAFLKALSAVGVGAAGWSARRRNPTPVFGDTPFTLGVASGDPAADGFVLWTRLAPDPLVGGGMNPEAVEVGWEVATDDTMANVVRTGSATATSELGHAVHVELDGLDPDRWYWYRFHVGSEESVVGRTRTMPAERADPDRFRFAFASCQHFEQGLYTAYDHLVNEDLSAVFFLGDYIYEYRGFPGRVRRHLGQEIQSVEDYRIRYAQYRSDPALRRAHAAFPWIVTWDDHEVDNDYADEASENGDPVDEFLVRRANAYQVYYESMPIRASAMPTGPDMRLYRTIQCGQLASFRVLDTRQYRSDQTCGGGRDPVCDAMFDPARTMLGDEQERWLFDSFDDDGARWNVLAQQVPVTTVDFDPGPGQEVTMDKWPGYPAAQERLLGALVDRSVRNPVVLTGDVHTNWVYDLKRDYEDEAAAVVGTEFVGTSISSGGDGGDRAERRSGLMSQHPQVRYYNGERGYVVCEVTPERWTTAYRTVPYVERPGASITTRATFVVENGRPGAIDG